MIISAVTRQLKLNTWGRALEEQRASREASDSCPPPPALTLVSQQDVLQCRLQEKLGYCHRRRRRRRTGRDNCHSCWQPNMETAPFNQDLILDAVQTFLQSLFLQSDSPWCFLLIKHQTTQKLTLFKKTVSAKSLIFI